MTVQKEAPLAPVLQDELSNTYSSSSRRCHRRCASRPKRQAEKAHPAKADNQDQDEGRSRERAFAAPDPSK